MGVIFKNGYGCGYSSTRLIAIPTHRGAKWLISRKISSYHIAMQ